MATQDGFKHFQMMILIDNFVSYRVCPETLKKLKDRNLPFHYAELEIAQYLVSVISYNQ